MLFDRHLAFCYLSGMLSIVMLGDEVLRKQASVIPDIDRSISNLAAAMIDTMHVGKGIGLAGPQVGELKRIFVTHVEGDTPRVFINPQIIRTSPGQSTYEEGCLSVPGIFADVLRPVEVSVQAWNEKGRPFTIDAEGVLARAILHENDHLNGVMFLDHLEERKRHRLIRTFDRKHRPAAV